MKLSILATVARSFSYSIDFRLNDFNFKDIRIQHMYAPSNARLPGGDATFQVTSAKGVNMLGQRVKVNGGTTGANYEISSGKWYTFAIDYNIYNSPFFRFLNEENTYLSELADFYFTKEQYQDALYAFQAKKAETQDVTSIEESVETYKKIGYCHQKLMDYRKAIDAYEKCEIIEEGNLWVNKNIAYCYKKLSKYDSALKYYQIADSLSENNISIIFNLAICFT